MNTNIRVPEASSRFIRPFNEMVWFEALPGEALSIRLHSREVQGKFCILENIAAPGTATPHHTHEQDEIFHILEGEILFCLNGNLSVLSAGDIALVPAGISHAWRNTSEKPVRMTAVFAPGGIETMFTRLAGKSPEDVIAIAAEHGTIVTGPPIEL